MLMADLTDDELALFVPHLYERRYAKNEVVFFRNDPAQAFYIVKSGYVQLTLDLEDKFEQLVVLSSHDFFGESGLFNNMTRVYNAFANVDNTELYVIPRINLMEIFEANDKIKAKIMSAMAYMLIEQKRKLFNAYRETFTFFDLGTAYNREDFGVDRPPA